MLYLFVFFILIAETIAISFIKQFSLTHQSVFFVLGVLFYGLAAFFLYKSLKYEDMGIVNALWSAFSVLFVLGTGVFYFKEDIGYVQMIGVVLILAGVFILRYKLA